MKKGKYNIVRKLMICLILKFWKQQTVIKTGSGGMQVKKSVKVQNKTKVEVAL